ncbi:MAG: alpha/beta fold hydrolase [Actinophytocola sp.]|uniref:thioesterase II family protein n=1 Tax=Actinophytocola sp. TaxID=1872138 RepID=UPI003C71B271
MSWLMPFAPSRARPVLVCLPQAGSGCGVFRSWQDALGDTATVVGVQLPGRENRFAEPPPESFAHAVDEIVTALVNAVGRPTVLFGHSLGGLIGYEVARALPTPPDALVVAASQPPHRNGKIAGIALDTDEDLEAALAAKELDEDLRELAFTVLRQDADMAATYESPSGAPLPCDLHAWGGEADERVPAGDLDGWRDYAGPAFHSRVFAGGHDFCLEKPEAAAAVRALLPTWQEV